MNTRSTRHRWMAVSLSFVIALTAACGGDDDDDSGASASTTPAAVETTSAGESATTSAVAPDTTTVDAGDIDYTVAPTQLSVTTPVSGAIPEGLEIIYLSPGFDQAIRYLNGIKAGAEVLGWTVRDMTYDAANPATINSTIESAIAEKPDAIVVLPLLNDQLTTALAKAQDAGIPIISALTPDEALPGLYPVLRTNVSAQSVGRMVADAVLDDAEQSGDTAHVLKLTNGTVNVLHWNDVGVQAEVEARCADCTLEILDLPLADIFSGAYTQQVVSYLQAHPEVNYVVSGSGQSGIGLEAALDQAGIDGIKRYGFSPLDAQVEELKAGEAGAWAVEPYEVGGWIIVDLIARIKTGDPTDVWDEETLAYLINADNAAEFDANRREFPVGYEDMFKALWGK